MDPSHHPSDHSARSVRRVLQGRGPQYHLLCRRLLHVSVGALLVCMCVLLIAGCMFAQVASAKLHACLSGSPPSCREQSAPAATAQAYHWYANLWNPRPLLPLCHLAG